MLFNSAIFFLFFGIFYAGYLALYQIEKRIPEIGRRCRFIFLVTAWRGESGKVQAAIYRK